MTNSSPSSRRASASAEQCTTANTGPSWAIIPSFWASPSPEPHNTADRSALSSRSSVINQILRPAVPHRTPQNIRSQRRGWQWATGVVACAAIFMFGACDQADQPDRVVAVVLKCEKDFRSLQPGGFSHEVKTVTGPQCSDGGTNVRRELTVRTPHGDTYTAEVDTDSRVAVGDQWPP